MKKPIETLQENASSFFDKTEAKYPDQMECKSGCSKCCMTDISIFEVEADLIRDWFKNLELNEKENLLKLWASPPIEGACSFLYDSKCTVYSARPIICRTQGLPLHLSADNSLDFCRLNFKKVDPPKEDWLNLDRLNTLLSFAAKTSDRDKRIRLKKLKTELLG